MNPEVSAATRSKSAFWIFGVVAAAAILGLLIWKATQAPNSTSDERAKVAFVTVGPVSDWGFNHQHEQGRLALQERLNDKVQTILVERIPETGDAERVFQRLADDGATLIYATSYGYLDFAHRVSQRNPKTTFMHCLGTKEGPNFGTYSAHNWEAAYVCGVVAAMTVKDPSRLGFVASHRLPPILWVVNAFTLGAQSINPNSKVSVIFTNSWADPTAEVNAVKALAQQGTELVYVIVDSSLAGVQAAEREGMFSMAHHADLSRFAPNGWVTGFVWGWDQLYVDVTTRVLDGSWKPGHVSGGMKEGYVKLASFGPRVPELARERALKTINKINTGELKVFIGPIRDEKGAIRVPDFQSLDVPGILSMDWTVQGVNAR
jgi:basic membrane protein A